MASTRAAGARAEPGLEIGAADGEETGRIPAAAANRLTAGRAREAPGREVQ
jgi:hypothetical protein